MAVNWNFELTNIALFAGAVIAALYARRQVVELRESNRKQAESGRNQEHQLRASVLLTLDQRWESPQMLVVRADLEKLIAEVFEAARKDNSQPGAVIGLLSAPYFKARLNELGASDSRKQLRLLQACGFFETVGYVTSASYITLDDVYELLGGSILTAAMVFMPYIDELLSRGANRKLYQNFRWLVDQVKRREAISLVE